MREAAHTKMGFYPIHPDVVSLLLPIVRDWAGTPIPPTDPTILDPCAGEGAALKQFADHLHLPYSQCYAVELDDGRTQVIRETMPGVHLPTWTLPDKTTIPVSASIFGMEILVRQFSLLYLNPPFSNELGGQRSELLFLAECTRYLMPGGLLIFILPQRVLQDRKTGENVCKFLDSSYDPVQVFEFPIDHRQYNEVAVVGVKRKHGIPADDGMDMGRWFHKGYGWENPLRRQRFGHFHRYVLPTGLHPKNFFKRDYTDAELLAELNQPSDLHAVNAVLETPEALQPHRPGLPLHEGHTSLMLTGGILDGVLHPEEGESIVVRGTAYKDLRVTNEIETDTFVETTEEDQVVMLVRAVGADGTIHSFDQ